jgi:23S rRNA pseudouridine955/2504/2580 synthase
MEGLSKNSATWLGIDESAEGQRIDNFLARLLKGVPRPHIYQLLRTGQVRVNSRRVDATYRLHSGDHVRIPPVRRTERRVETMPRSRLPDLAQAVLYEDEHLLVLNKPAGLAVHGGSGIVLGAIEEMRLLRPKLKFLELVHRLDRDTSGVLLLAKKRSALVSIHAALRSGAVRKFYRLLVKGSFRAQRRQVDAALDKYLLPGGDRRVKVAPAGQEARTVFTLVHRVGDYSLLEAELFTGRTHQIRVHAAHLGHPILGDDKYGDFELNKALAPRDRKSVV